MCASEKRVEKYPFEEKAEDAFHGQRLSDHSAGKVENYLHTGLHQGHCLTMSKTISDQASTQSAASFLD